MEELTIECRECGYREKPDESLFTKILGRKAGEAYSKSEVAKILPIPPIPVILSVFAYNAVKVKMSSPKVLLCLLNEHHEYKNATTRNGRSNTHNKYESSPIARRLFPILWS